jgi:hypothetical protein
MLPREPERYVSFIATNFLFPLTKLLEALDEFENEGPNEVQSAPLENGFSIGIIVLAVLLTESAIGRTQYTMGITQPRYAFIKKTFPDNDLPGRIEELFVLRDIIVHSHIWEAGVYWDENFEMKLIKAEKTRGRDDGKYTNSVDKKTRLTRLLGLNVFPTRICRSDAIKVVKSVMDFLLTLEKKDPNYFRISNQWVKYNGSVVRFTDVVAKLRA